MRNRVNVLQTPKPNLRNVIENMEYALSDVLNDIGSNISCNGNTRDMARDVRDMTYAVYAMQNLRSKMRMVSRVNGAVMCLNNMSERSREYFNGQFIYYMECYA